MLLELFNFMHFVGLAFGLGGATIATIISVKADKDAELSKVFGKIMPSISKLIFFGLLLLIISGIALPFYISWPLNKQMLIVKHVLVFWIVVFGIMIGRNSKYVMRFGNRDEAPTSRKWVAAKKKIKIFSIINLILWYVVTLMSAFV